VAATLDLGIKQQRREQWNKAIAEVKQELSTAEDDDTRFSQVMEQNFIANEEMRKNLDSTPFRYNTPSWPESTGQDRWDGRLAPDSIYASEIRKRKALQVRWNAKKLERVQLSVDVLQLEFFAELHRRGWCQEAADAVPATYAQFFMRPSENIHRALATKRSDLARIYEMKGLYLNGERLDEEGAALEFQTWRRSDTDEPLCEYRQDEGGKFHRTAHELNASLRELFDKGRRRELPQPAVLAMIYHNLSLSSAPPNVDTFNTLIVGLSDIGTRRLVEDCINAFRATQIRTNEVSLASILNYYTYTDNRRQFRHWVMLMRGDLGGLSTAQPGVDITPNSQGRLIRWKNKVIQLPSPTPMVFSALVKGVVKFSGLDAAVKVCAAMRDEGWGLSMSGLQPLLKACAEAGDWGAGLHVWKIILALKHRATERRSIEWESRTVNLPTFASMLNLCSRCGQRSAFQDIMNQAMAAHPKYVSQLVDYLKAERAADDHGHAQRLAAAGPRACALHPHAEQDFKYVEVLAEKGAQTIAWPEIPDIQYKQRREEWELKRAWFRNSAIDTSPEPNPVWTTRREPEVHPKNASPTIHHETSTAALHPGHEEPARIADTESVTEVMASKNMWPADSLQNAPQSQEQLHSYTPFTPEMKHYKKSERLSGPSQSAAISQEHLHGYISFTPELEDYENGERPMSLAG
jgi:hypothetical protein